MSEHPPGGPGSAEEPEIGSVSDEAAKLLGALSDWAGDQGTDLGRSLSGLAGTAAAALTDVNEHVATGAAECTYCPVCRTVHVVRRTRPEVRAHLTSAATSLLQAVAGLMATHVPDGSQRAGVEQIDLDPDEAGWPES